jgi:eukaryotic-like serine/threonine-protein kinase
VGGNVADEFERLRGALAQRYAVHREIGRGGMATVYLAEDLKHGRPVALKVFKPEIAASLGSERFLREINLTARLDHPHIVPLLDSGEADGLLYFAMPFVEGGSLRDRLDREKQLPLHDALQITREAADALSHAHGLGVVHRDIKPENILLSGGHARVADFGIARAVSAAGGQTVTQTSFAVGTPAYMSPEQAAGDRTVDGRSDQYGLACVVYEMLAGRPPFTGATMERVVHQHMVKEPPPVTAERPAVPAAADRVIRQALQKTAADRFSTVSEFAEALAAAMETPGADAPTPTPPRARRWPMIALGGVAAILALALLAGYLALKTGDRPPVTAAVPRLVVLPFENLGTPDEEYFADGITDEITARLSGLSGLAVIARQSAIQYKGTDKPPQQIGQELDAAYLLEATISWQRNPDGPSRVRIRPQLIRAPDATHLWADVLDEDLTEVFAVQTRIANRVVEALGIALREPERRSLAVVPTRNHEAHDYYLRGLNYSGPDRVFGARETRIAIGLYERAVELDPGFALAHAALALGHFELYWFAADRTPDRLATMKEAVDRALALDPGLVEGRLALASYHYARFDYDAALRELQPLRARQPHNAEVIASIGFVHRRQGAFDEAIANLEMATRLGPRSAQWWYNLGETYWLVRDYAAAERVLSRAVELAPEWPSLHYYLIRTRVTATGSTAGARRALVEAERFGLGAHPYLAHEAVWLDVLDRRYEDAVKRLQEASKLEDSDWQFWFVPQSQWLAKVYRLMGHQDQARAHFEAARQVLETKAREFPGDPRYHSSLGIVYAGLGRRDEALRAARHGVELLPISKEAYRGLYAVEALAQVHTMVGEHDAAIGELERLLSIPSHLSAPLLRLDPRWDPLREHPRFRRLVEQ